MKFEIIADPPYEHKGRGTPTTGTIPVTIPTLIKIIIKKEAIKLIPKIFEK
tara:strand:+ start:487 stop:639 length:153 start_codon:yes stop_codon:yes gene_type:complete